MSNFLDTLMSQAAKEKSKGIQGEIIEGEYTEDSRALVTTQQHDIDLAKQVKYEYQQQIGQDANQQAAQNVFENFRKLKAQNTLDIHDNNLRKFREALHETGVDYGDLLMPENWRNITWGIVQNYVDRLLNDGFSIGSVNLALSTIKTYAKLASKAGVLDKLEYLQIKDVPGFSKNEAKRVNEKRPQTRKTRMVGKGENAIEKPIKKAKYVELSYKDRQRLKHEHPDTPQGRRDRVLMCILLDHGLRCGEVALLDVTSINLTARTMTFYRPKVHDEGQTQTIELSKNTYDALKTYAAAGDMPAIGKLLRGSRKSKEGYLTTNGMTERAITARVATLGCKVDKCGLSAHDCRHSWATEDFKKYKDMKRLQVLGGWSSMAMPGWYAHVAEIANEGASDID